jgi:hypothetical protein
MGFWTYDLLTPAGLAVFSAGLTFAVISLIARSHKGKCSSTRFRHFSSPKSGFVAVVGSLLVFASVLILDSLTQKARGGFKAGSEQKAGDPVVSSDRTGPSARMMNRYSMEGSRFDKGTTAPDFTLPDVETGELVQFSKYRANRPAVLILGSFGCNLFCYQLDQLQSLYKSHKDKVAFLFVKVKDADHPVPPHLLQAFEEAGMKDETPENRLRRARLSLMTMDFHVPCLLDDEDRHVESMYGAFPKRLVVVDAGGQVVLDAGRGMRRLKESDALPTWDIDALEACLQSLR